MDFFKKKPKKVTVTVTDPDTGRAYETEVEPGTPEFAAATKQMVDAALSEVKQKIGQENWDALCTTMFACSYDKGEGMAQCIDGNTNQLLILMAATVHEMADAEVKRQQFLPKKKGGNEIIAAYVQSLIGYVNSMDRDDGAEKESSIITDA